MAVAGLAYLFATKQGKETRASVAKSATKAVKAGTKAAGKALDKVNDVQDGYPDLYKVLSEYIPGAKPVGFAARMRRKFS